MSPLDVLIVDLGRLQGKTLQKDLKTMPRICCKNSSVKAR